MERALAQWNLDITHATQGLEALEAVRAGKGELLFLDLNMPLLDGYEVLERIRREDLPILTLVVSGDIQPEARERVRQLGALDFIRKPIDMEQLRQSLRAFGLLEELERPAAAVTVPVTAAPPAPAPGVISETLSLQEHYQELANVAMGQAADLLAQLLNTFIELPIPSVKLLEYGELDMAMQQALSQSDLTTVCQGFVAQGICGEALLMLTGTQINQLAHLLRHQGELNALIERELTMEIANVLIGAFLNGLGQQLDMTFSQSSPLLMADLPTQTSHRNRQERILSIDISYRIEGLAVNCDLLLLFTEDSLPKLNELTSHL
ncbi:response regulator [Marinobacterium sp. A346]|uniref:Response regulator n=2 Tax=Marinobacterium weihaiense TaxID=2851016 RepID=A0ABS6MA84_9GAMM|nr:response regulator [Marinobacterium weihaiense]